MPNCKHPKSSVVVEERWQDEPVGVHAVGGRTLAYPGYFYQGKNTLVGPLPAGDPLFEGKEVLTKYIAYGYRCMDCDEFFQAKDYEA